MVSGRTTTQELTDSIPTIIASARIVREYEGVMQRLCDKETLGEGTGLTWNEVDFAKLDAFRVSETTELNNPQQLSDSLFTITPNVIGMHTVITDRVYKRLSKNAVAKIGPLAQNAIERLKDQDGLTMLDGATTSLPGAGNTLTTGHISAAATRVRYGGGNEPSKSPIRFVGHAFMFRDLYDELTAGIGTYPVPDGDTARVFKEGFRGQIDGCMLFEDNLITIDSSDDAKGGVFAQEAIVLVQGRAPRSIPIRNEKLGGGASEVVFYDEYAYGERSSGNWLYEIYADCTAPTS